MDVFYSMINNFLDPTILFFILGLIAVLLKSDLNIPISIGKFLSVYLLLSIGVRGGAELLHSGITPTVITILTMCFVLSVAIPFICYPILNYKLDRYNTCTIAASYGSCSAVTFITAASFLENRDIYFDAFMVSGLAIMETPAIISGLILIKLSMPSTPHPFSGRGLSKSIHEALTNGSVILLIGSLIIGYIAGMENAAEMKPFVGSIFKGMLSIYMLEMGLIAGSEFGLLRKSGKFLILFALFYSPIAAVIIMLLCYVIQLSAGNALLMVMLGSSASYIAVPAAMRYAVPEANLSLLLPMTLGITFTYNVTIGIPLYNSIVQHFWS